MAEEVKLSTLRVSAQMDASQYKAGADQIATSSQQAGQAVNQLGVTVTNTGVKISQAGDVGERLSRQYVDGYANAQRMNSAVNQLSSGIERGKITMQQADAILQGISQKYGLMADASQFASRGQVEFAAAIDRSNAKLREQEFWHKEWLREFNKQPNVTRVQAASNQNTLGAFGAFNTGQQLQDIAVTAAMGQSIPTIALQQGLQLGTALEIQLENARKAGVGMGTALRSSFLGILSPINLVAIGLTAVAVAAIQFGSKLLPETKSLKEAIDDQRKAVNDLAEAYGAASIKAEDFARKSEIGAGAAARTATEDLRKSADAANREALGQLTRFVTPGRSAGGFFGPTQSDFKPFNDAIQELNKEVRSGHPDFDRFENSIHAIVLQQPGLQGIADRILNITNAAADAARQLGKTADILAKFNEIRVPELGILPKGAAGDALRAAELGQMNRMQTQFGAETAGIGARSPQELAAAARAAAGATFNQDEGKEARNLRIELAGKKALLEAEHQLKDAQDERRRSLDRTLDSAKLDVELVGKTTAEIEGLRMAAQLEADVRETAARNHVAADEVEIANIRKKAEEIGKLKAIEQAETLIKSQQDDLEMQRAEVGAVGLNKLAHDALINSLKTEQEIRKLGIDPIGKEAEALRANTAAANANAEALAKAGLASDLAFERRQIGRDDQDQAIASRLKAAGLPDDLNSVEAGMIRTNLRLSEAKDDFKGFFHDVLDGFRQGKDAVEAFQNALSNLAGKLADRFLDRAMDELFGALTGTGGQSSTGGTGLLGLFGGLFGGGGTSQAFSPNTTLAAILGAGGGAANDNFTSGAYTTDISNKILAGLGSPLGGAANGILSGGGGDNSLVGSSGGVASQVWSFFKGKGLSDTQVAGIMGNVSAESAFRPGAVGDNGNALGLFQWNDRSTAMKNFVGSDWRTDTSGQLNFAWKEMQSSEGLAYRNLLRSSDVRGATRAFAGFERPRGFSYDNPEGADNFSGRLSGARSAYGQFSGKDVGGATAALDKLAGVSTKAADGLQQAGLSGFSMVKGLTDASGGLTHFGSLLQGFMGAGGGSGTSWFQGLSSLFGGAGGAINSMMSISPGATSAILAGGALGPAGLYHEGGIAGSPGSMRFVAPGVFAGARRYHMGGLAGDEVPAILRRGEPVFRNMDHARSVVGANQNIDAITAAVAKRININLKNINVYDPSVVGDYARTDEGEKALINVQRRTGTGRGL